MDAAFIVKRKRKRMIKIICKKILQAIPVLIVVSVLSFMIVYCAPGDPVNMYIKPEMTKAQIEKIRESLGLNAGIGEQYLHWAKNILQGNLGNSLVNHQSVAKQIVEKLPATLKLMGASLVLSLIVAIPIGMLSGYKENSRFDKNAMIFSYIGISIPKFWFAMMGIVVFTLKLKWLPNSGMRTVGIESVGDQIRHIIMPAISLSLYNMAVFIRYVRSHTIRELKQEYVYAAKAKGLTMRAVLKKHVLKNCLLPIITLVGMNMSELVTGSIIIESVFGWPGMGTLGMTAITSRDYPMVMGVTMLSCLVLLVGNFLADALYCVIDPRIQKELKASVG